MSPPLSTNFERKERIMDNNQTVTLESTDTPAPKPKLTPDEAVEMVRELRDRLPIPDPTDVAVSGRRRAAQVDPAFASAAVNAAGAVEPVQTAVGYTDGQLRDEMDAGTRWSQFTDELRALFAMATHADTIRRQRIGLAALQIQKICVQMARDGRNRDALAPHIAQMKRTNVFRRSRRKPRSQQPPPQSPSPVPSTSTSPSPVPSPLPQPQAGAAPSPEHK
jgi:hypothetical protein